VGFEANPIQLSYGVAVDPIFHSNNNNNHSSDQQAHQKSLSSNLYSIFIPSKLCNFFLAQPKKKLDWNWRDPKKDESTGNNSNTISGFMMFLLIHSID